jgi:hypothetical protein
MAKRSTSAPLLSSLLLIAWPGVLPGQVHVPDRPLCNACSVEVRTLVGLGTFDGPGSLAGPPNQVMIDASGRYWIVDGQELPTVFDQFGEFAGTVGRRGRGPGEFLSAAAVLQAGTDSVLVLDLSTQRATVIGPDLMPVRGISLGSLGVINARAIAWPGEVVVHALSFSRDRTNWPLHHVSLGRNEMDVRRSFGPGNGEVRRGGSAAELLTTLANPGSASFWTSDVYAYRVAEWTPSGELKRLLERTPDWFPGRSRDGMGNPATPPPPRIKSIEMDSTGLLWVFAHVPAEDWRAAWAGVDGAASEISLRTLPTDRLYRTMLEVIDVDRQRVITRALLDEYVINALPDRRIAIYREVDGIPSIEIAELQMVGMSR